MRKNMKGLDKMVPDSLKLDEPALKQLYPLAPMGGAFDVLVGVFGQGRA